MPPRLLSLNNYHYRRGGSDVVYLEHDALFRQLGWQTAAFAMHHPRNEASDWSEYFVDELEFGHSYPLAAKIKMAAKTIYSWEGRTKLRALLDRFRPDVAHAHCIYHHLSPAVLPVLRAQGIPTVMTAHDLKVACPAYKMLNRTGVCERCKSGNVLHLIANRCIHGSLATSTLVAVEAAVHNTLNTYKRNLDRLVVPSLFFKRKLIEWGWNEGQLAYIPNFVRSDRYEAAFTPGKYFLYFGRLAPEKGVATLIKAAVAVNAQLAIAGTGPEENSLKALAGGHPNIRFLGYQAGEALWRLVRESRAVVLPSEWYENAPMSVLEANACGKPVIGATIGGIPEMVQDGVTGLLFDSGDSDDLQTRLRELSALPDERIAEMGRQAREFVATTFTEERYLAEMIALYGTIGVPIPSAS